jgi:dTDP-4-amino-4,6-dideoxygalactose transaminase
MTIPTKVPFMDLKRIHGPLKEEILARISSIIDRSAFVLGSEVEGFEKEFAGYVGMRHAIGVANGLDALKLALQAQGVGPGDEVITAANTFAATAFAISSVGARPVLADVEERTSNIDPSAVEKALSPRTKAILPVHLYGQPASMAPILALAEKRGIAVIEDCAQAHGASYEGKGIGTFGVMGCFSFYPGKNLGAMGDGGGVVTSSAEHLARLKVLRDVGQSEKYHHSTIGHNSRLDALQAAILSVKLRGLKEQTEDKVRTARRYGELLSKVSRIRLPEVQGDRTHVYHLYVIHVRDAGDREPLRQHLADRGVQTGLHYPIPLHLQKCYAGLGYRTGDFPVTEGLAGSLLSLPIFPYMTDEEIEAVVAGVRSYFRC